MYDTEYQKQYHLAHKEERNKKSKKWRAEHIEQQREYFRRFHAELKRGAFAYYSNGYIVCARCGIDDIDVLTIDHINGGGNEHRRELASLGLGHAFYHWLKREGYPKGFQVLCANCNLKKRIVEGK